MIAINAAAQWKLFAECATQEASNRNSSANFIVRKARITRTARSTRTTRNKRDDNGLSLPRMAWSMTSSKTCMATSPKSNQFHCQSHIVK